jgi:hypothetical protein
MTNTFQKGHEDFVVVITFVYQQLIAALLKSKEATYELRISALLSNPFAEAPVRPRSRSLRKPKILILLLGLRVMSLIRLS